MSQTRSQSRSWDVCTWFRLLSLTECVSLSLWLTGGTCRPARTAGRVGRGRATVSTAGAQDKGAEPGSEVGRGPVVAVRTEGHLSPWVLPRRGREGVAT